MGDTYDQREKLWEIEKLRQAASKAPDPVDPVAEAGRAWLRARERTWDAERALAAARREVEAARVAEAEALQRLDRVRAGEVPRG